jgi:protein SCO1/2
MAVLKGSDDMPSARHPGRVRLFVCAIVIALAGMTACADPPSVRGLVERVDDENGQVLLTQPGIEGVLPAGTTSLSANDAIREGIAPGQWIDVELARGPSGPMITSARFVRFATQEEGWIESGGKLIPAEPAEPIALFDTDGRPVTLAGLAGRVVLLDFIYTSCPGPCPAQTHNMRVVQKGLSENAKAAVQLVTVTIDPETDDAAAMAAYAARHSADLSNWSFLTGPVDVVEDTYTRYGIGVSEGEAGAMDHTLRSFVIDARGFVVERYRSDVFDPPAVIARLEALASER